MLTTAFFKRNLFCCLLLLLAFPPIAFLLLNRSFPLPDNVEYSTIITGSKQELLNAFLTSDQKWRMKTELSEISPLLRKAIIHKEDRYFYFHPGVNLMAAFKAFVNNILHGKRTSGASTITMQVARALEPKRRNYLNKYLEVFRAFQLEWKYSKDEILQLYLNLVPYGGNIEGVKSAATIYFQKSPDHLSLAEITALSIIPNRPSSLVIGKNNGKIVQERNTWLRKFQRDQVFSAKEILDALEEPLHAKRSNVPQLVPQLSYKLKKQFGGSVETNIVLNTQLKVEKLVQDYVRTLYYKNIRNASVVVIDNTSHAVVAYVGSADFTDTLDGGQVNGAAAIREPGSTLKPLLYGLCLDQGLLTPKMTLADVAVNYNGYAPENYDKIFNGYVSMEFALEHSLNIPAVRSLRMLGKDRLVNELARCDFRQVEKDRGRLGLSMILGGCGANLEELTAMYSCFANEGNYSRPAYIRQTKRKGGTKILSAPATFMINDILSKVNRPDFPMNWQSTERMPKIAWKTGTSYGRRDAWSIGYNKHFTVGIWVGNFSGNGNAALSGATVATPLLFKIFNTIDYDSDAEWFSQPAGCEIRMVCSETGLLPGDHCPGRRMDYFIPTISPNRICDNRQELAISADGSISYCKNCQPENGYRKKWYQIVSTEMQAYFETNHMAYEHVPPHNPACETILKEGAPIITFPSANAEYLISKKQREPLQLTCAAGDDVRRVFWYINNRLYKSSMVHSKEFFFPDEGLVKISCTDDKGRNRDVWITVRYGDL